MKYHLRQEGEGVRASMRRDAAPEEVYQWIHQALYQISPSDCRGWYRYCGYLP